MGAGQREAAAGTPGGGAEAGTAGDGPRGVGAFQLALGVTGGPHRAQRVVDDGRREAVQAGSWSCAARVAQALAVQPPPPPGSRPGFSESRQARSGARGPRAAFGPLHPV